MSILNIKRISCFFYLLSVIMPVRQANAQLCDPATPYFTTDLTGDPNGTWTSPSVSRKGLCCSASNPDVCIEIKITLDSAATGINFNIVSGAVPPGALYYQIDCGTPTPVGQPICLNGPGPYHLTFCKPGNNPNSYSITSFSPPEIAASISNVVSPNCSAVLAASTQNMNEASMTWSSIPFNATYNSFLNCTTGCDTVIITPSGTLPPYVNYRVCGSGFNACNSGQVCDTVRVYLFNALNVTVSPNALLCNGNTTAQISSSVSGGSGAYQYVWSTGETTASITAGAGTYTLSVTDTVVCNAVTKSSTITVVPPISCNAGNDVTVCSNQPSVALNGTMQTSTSALWTGGSGNFAPNNTSLNATYTPSASEIANGFARLVLQTTGNQGCPGASDTVLITIAPLPVPVVSGNLNVCGSNAVTYSAPNVAGTTYAWTVNGGIISGASNGNTVDVSWAPGSSGSVTLTMTNTAGCAASSTSNVTISQPVTSVAGNDIFICEDQASVLLNGSVQNANGFLWTGGSGTFNPGNSLNATYTPSAAEVNNGSVQLILQASANQGCPGSSDTIQISIGHLPNAVITGSNIICGSNAVNYIATFEAGATYSWTLNNGTFIGASNSNSVNVSWGAGSGSITLNMVSASGCSSSSTANVTISQPVTSLAGPDIAICEDQATVQLNGSVQNASGFTWMGGNGTFNPGNTSLNTIYTPSASEINNGFAQLILQAPANQGCPGVSDTILISIGHLPNASITGSTIICGSNAVTYNAPFEAGTTYSWTVNNGTIIGASNTNSVNVSWGAGSGSINLTMMSTSVCSSSATTSVSISQPVTSLAGNDMAICEDQTTIVLNGNVQNSSGFVWLGGSGVFSPNNTFLSPSYTPSAAEINNGYVNLVLQASGNQGCPGVSDTIQVSIGQLPDATVTGSTVICGSNAVNYSAPLESSTTYSWTVNGGMITGGSNGNSVSVSWGTGSSGTLTLNMTNASGCVATSTLNVNLSQPVLSAAGNDLSICADQTTIMLAGNVQNASGFAWLGGSGTFNPGNTSLNTQYIPSTTEINNGYVNLVLQAAANQGCPGVSDTIHVTISQMPVATITGSNVVCGNSNVIYSAPFEAGTTYNWNITGGSIAGSSNANVLNVTWGAGNSGTLNLTMTNNAGCTSQSTATISIAQPVISNAGADVSICASQHTVLLSGGVQNTPGFSWTGGSGSYNPDNTVLNPVYTPSAAEVSNGFVNLILQTLPNQGCPGLSDTIQILINALPQAMITGNAVACVNSSSSYSTPLGAGYTYAWSVAGGNITGASNSNSVNVSWGNAAGGLISLTVTSANGCTANTTQNIPLVILPNPTVTGTNSSCQYSTSIYAVNPSQGSTYAWSVVNGNILGNNSGTSLQVHWTTPGNGTVTVVETNSFGCSQNITLDVMITAQPIPEISGSSLVCTGTGMNEYTAPLVSNATYTWNVTGGTIQSGNGSNSIQVMWSAAGQNNITLTIANSSGCDSTVSFSVLASGVNNASVQSSGLNGCPPLSVSFAGNQPAPGQVYNWSFGDFGESSMPNPVHVYTTPGNYPVSVFTQNPNGCVDSATALVTVYETPEAAFSHNFESAVYYIGESTLEITNTSQHASAYAWSFGTGETVNAFEPEKMYTEEGEYVIMLITTNAQGCRDTALKEIQVKNHEHIYVANAFTPNGDGTNDFFSLLQTNMKESSINIFDRWGHVIFASDDLDFRWDGTYMGHSVESGVYVYKILAIGESGKSYPKIGTVTVVR